MLLFSFFLLVRGHNEPGGGFAGGLVAASAITLFAIAEGVSRAQRIIPVEPIFIIVSGLTVALLSGIIPLFFGKPFLTGLWLKEAIPVLGKFGTPFLFDIGVYILVVGFVLKIVFALAKEESE
jgi:multicomponent Na+:H+ antiporter subunit B